MRSWHLALLNASARLGVLAQMPTLRPAAGHSRHALLATDANHLAVAELTELDWCT